MGDSGECVKSTKEREIPGYAHVFDRLLARSFPEGKPPKANEIRNGKSDDDNV